MAKAALDAKRLNAFAMDPEDLTIMEDEKHPLYDPRVKLPVQESLVLNIMRHGVRQPVIVTKIGDKTAVVDGRQRVRACQEANKRLKKDGLPPLLVPVMVARGDEHGLFEIGVSLNENRIDDNPMMRAEKAQRLIDTGRAESDVAVTFGVTETAVKAWLKLLELAPAVKKAVKTGEISATAAAALHGKAVDEQEKLLKEAAKAGGKASARNVRRAAAGKQATKRTRKHRPGSDVLETVALAAPPAIGILINWIMGDTPAEEVKKHHEWFPVEALKAGK